MFGDALIAWRNCAPAQHDQGADEGCNQSKADQIGNRPLIGRTPFLPLIPAVEIVKKGHSPTLVLSQPKTNVSFAARPRAICL